VLPKHLKDKVSETVDYFCRRRMRDNEFVNNPYGLKRWQGLVHYMNEEDWSDKLPILYDYLSVTDQQRGTDYKKVFPDLTL
jgi:hypothetical protein